MASVRAFDLNPNQLNKTLRMFEKMDKAVKSLGNNMKNNLNRSFADLGNSANKANNNIERTEKALGKLEKRIQSLKSATRLFNLALGAGFKLAGRIAGMTDNEQKGSRSAYELNTTKNKINAFDMTTKNLGLDFDASDASILRNNARWENAGYFATATGDGNIENFRKGDALDNYVTMLNKIVDRINEAGGFDSGSSQHIRDAANAIGFDDSILKQFAGARGEFMKDLKENEKKASNIETDKWKSLEKALGKLGDSVGTLMKHISEALVPALVKLTDFLDKAINGLNSFLNSDFMKSVGKIANNIGDSAISAVGKGVSAVTDSVKGVYNWATGSNKSNTTQRQNDINKSLGNLDSNSKENYNKVLDTYKTKTGKELGNSEREQLIKQLQYFDKVNKENNSKIDLNVTADNNKIYIKTQNKTTGKTQTFEIAEFAQATNTSK